MSDNIDWSAIIGITAVAAMSGIKDSENIINPVEDKIEGFNGKSQSEIEQVEESEIKQPDKTVKLTAEQKEYLIEKIKKMLDDYKGYYDKMCEMSDKLIDELNSKDEFDEKFLLAFSAIASLYSK